ncbi:hypothetical protein Tco_1489372 [Tanacetum coccineum]
MLGGGCLRMVYTVAVVYLALGLHTAEEMTGDGFDGYWADSLREIVTKEDLSGYWSRIASDGNFLEMVPKKVTTTDLFYLRSIDEGTSITVPYLLAYYLFRHTEGRKREARMSSSHFVGCLAEHFRLQIFERLGDTWAWVAPGPERQQVAAAGAAQADQEIPEEGV